MHYLDSDEIHCQVQIYGGMRCYVICELARLLSTIRNLSNLSMEKSSHALENSGQLPIISPRSALLHRTIIHPDCA